MGFRLLTSAEPAVGGGVQRRLGHAFWLLRLRWVAVVGQLLTVGFVQSVLRIELPLPPILTVIGLTALSNVGFAVWLTGERSRELLSGEPVGDRLLAGVMISDILALTGLLHFAGGLSNPFSVFYFVNLALAAVILPPRWGWLLTGLAACCLAMLCGFSRPLADLEAMVLSGPGGRAVPIRQLGFVVAAPACALVVVYFITRINDELRQRERDLRSRERLESLGTLAAGAGHELATPLSTIAVVAQELTRLAEQQDMPAEADQDIRLIRDEVERCRLILNRMSGRIGQEIGESMIEISVDRLLDHVVHDLPGQARVVVDCAAECQGRTLALPLDNVSQAIRGIVQNALDASAEDQTVSLIARPDGRRITIAVRDRGAGMSADILARVGDPFYTTKDPGQGMGLGLYLARSVIERVGGQIEIESSPESGTEVRVRLPGDS